MTEVCWVRRGRLASMQRVDTKSFWKSDIANVEIVIRLQRLGLMRRQSASRSYYSHKSSVRRIRSQISTFVSLNRMSGFGGSISTRFAVGEQQAGSKKVVLRVLPAMSARVIDTPALF